MRSGVAKRLGACSLFVQLISEVAPLEILRDFELPLTNILMSSGGKFYLLLPNLPDTGTKLAAFQERTDQWCLKKLNGSPGRNLAWVPFGEAGFQAFGSVLKAAIDCLAERKEQRFREALVTSEMWQEKEFLFSPFGRDQQVCPSCGNSPAPREEGA